MYGRPVIGVIGAGAAGTLTAVALARSARAQGSPLEVVLLDRNEHGPGLAYATGDPDHVLNVPARDMGAFADDPRHFAQWRRDRGCTEGGKAFAPRGEYGAYLREVLAGELGDDGTVALVARVAEVRAVHRGVAGPVLALASGETLQCVHAVLALGNFPPGETPGLEPAAARHPRHIANPWAAGALARAGGAGSAVLVGTGLTMADVALTLARDAPGLRLHAISRNGLLPRAHDPALPPRAEPVVASGATLTEAVRAVRGAEGPWRPVVDGLRPVAQGLWRGFDLAERRTFLARYARQWDVHRHRMPPATAERLGALRTAGRLTVERGLIESIRPSGDGLAVSLRGREPLEAAWVVNCTGPCADVHRVPDPLVQQLLQSGQARRHPLGLGLDTAPGGAVRDAHGQTAALWTLGSLRRGELYETTAIPEIRRQAAELGARLAIRTAVPVAA